ncbi:hypothetical protein ABT297_04275 [Dactylosporangium sp. NPDC000555]|uniref:helix-turn-helix domain-containing protein n=1 Tax=Dactylosporangium sp. NPDC000555 TaxID=3154260 RepID=UPI00331DD8FF
MRETPVLDSPVRETKVEPLKPMYVSVKDAGIYLGRLVPREIYRLLDAGELESVHHGRRRLVDTESLEAYGRRLKRHTAETENAQHEAETENAQAASS